MQSDILPNENAAQDESAEPTGNRDVAREKCWGGGKCYQSPNSERNFKGLSLSDRLEIRLVRLT